MRTLAKVISKGKEYTQPFSNAGWWTDIRYKLIKLLAGDTTVILNVNMSIEERGEYAVRVQDGGFLMINNKFGFPEHTLLLRKNK